VTSQLEPQRRRLAELQQQRAELVDRHTRTSLIAVAVEPREMRVLRRGNWMDKAGEVVAPGVPLFLRQIEKTERPTRLDLANWLVDRQHPLTARVFVNRLWKLYFGTGLSKVLDDIGAQGEPPSHPQLLDTLAVEFMESGWDIKQMVRLLVMSQTYRQSSLPREEVQKMDAYNRLLARQSRYRFDAELIRDNALAVSGLLVARLGGRSAKPYQPAGLLRHLNFPPREYQADTDENQYRRGVYTHWQRQFLHPALQAFDAPAREECTAERPRSNTPLAALVLLNDPSHVEAARVLAEHALQTVAAGPEARLSWMMRQALSREPLAAEQAVLKDLLLSEQQAVAQSPETAKQLISVGLSPPPPEIDPAELSAWTAVARAILNMHEIVTRN
jgi:hypothetical protein